MLSALKWQNLEATAIVLAYAHLDQEFSDIHKQAFNLALSVRDDELRHSFFRILSRCGLVKDSAPSREELVRDVIIRNLPLVELLVDAGMCLDATPHNALCYAILRQVLDILELFADGICSSAIGCGQL